MFTVRDLVQPETVEEAYNTLMLRRSNTVLGGCTFLRMGAKRIGTAIDLSKLKLRYIEEHADYIEIGAMSTFRDMETSTLLKQYFNGVVPKAVSNVLGVQFRNCVTVGASVFSKYGFSDLLTPLLALDTEVELFKAGRMPLQEFLHKPYAKDILTRVFIGKNASQVSYQSLRNSAGDFPLLNAAVACVAQEWRIVVGARPLKAKMAEQASAVLGKRGLITTQDIEEAARQAAEELSFGSNIRATAEYRKAMCRVLVHRAVSEVLQCK